MDADASKRLSLYEIENEENIVNRGGYRNLKTLGKNLPTKSGNFGFCTSEASAIDAAGVV